MKDILRTKNIVITGIAYKQVYDEIRGDLTLSCPDVLVKDIKISYPPVNYHKSDIKPRKSDVVGCSFRSQSNKLNVVATRYVSEIRELWVETNQSNPDFLVIHCINSEVSNGVVYEDRPGQILTSLLPQRPRAILFAIAGAEDIAKQVSNYVDIAVRQEYEKYNGFVTKIFHNKDELFRTSYNEIIARKMNSFGTVKYSSGIYSLIDEVLGQRELTCVKLSNVGIRERPKHIARVISSNARNDCIGDPSVNYGYNEGWRQYRQETDQWRAPTTDAGGGEYHERSVSETVKNLLDRWKHKSPYEYYYSESESSQSAYRENGESGYTSFASYTRPICNVSDTDSAGN